MRIRGSVIIVENKKVGLIKRERNDSTYYVFPGGGIEKGETIEEGTKREAFEELGVEVKLNKCIATYEYNGRQYFYHSEIINGIFGTGVGEEFTVNRLH
ncbi:NUDIX domain-containing protein [Niallia sp. MER 6]|uniref:NUDIX domain-containing protein n=1 Tax=Niallia sp. MER 6 TaxID=2939567 RepID=UPI00203C56FF|nr:NUDIX domain-containing protein [Niallia sp. MER 6]MCM3034319.1 NUDIX domain-containing protein [Niallia sp. MER 6]